MAELVRYIRRQTFWSLSWAVLSLAAVFLGSRGLISDKMGDPIYHGTLLGALMLGMVPLFAPYWSFEMEESDGGFPRTLPGLAVLLGGIPWALAWPAAMLLWPMLLRGGERPWAVDGSLPSDAIGLAIAALFALMVYHLGMTCLLPVFVPGRSVGVILAFVVLMLIALFVAPLLGDPSLRRQRQRSGRPDRGRRPGADDDDLAARDAAGPAPPHLSGRRPGPRAAARGEERGAVSGGRARPRSARPAPRTTPAPRGRRRPCG